MKRINLYLSLFTISLVLLAACSGVGEPTVMDDNATSSQGVEAPMVDDEAEDEEMSATRSDESMADDAMDETMSDESMEDETMRDESMGDKPMDDEAPMTEHEGSDEAMEQTMEVETIDDEAAAGADLSGWQQLPLTDAVTGATFTLGDFAGRTVFVEPMATWCTNCRQQLRNVQSAQAQLDAEDAVFVALSVETNLSAADLQRYAADNGFNWTFAVATPELLQALVEQFGRTITNPPSTPHFIIRSDGSTTELATGVKSPDEILAELRNAES